jgi:hypothetical protein
MTNTPLLEDKIAKSGKKVKFLAERCGMSYAGFRNCVINKRNPKTNTVAEFRVSQVDILCEELNITSLEEKEMIFYFKG